MKPPEPPRKQPPTAAELLDPDESLWDAIAFHLRFERQKRGLSQAQVGKIIGVNKYGVSNLEAGRNKLTKEQAERLDDAWQSGGLFGRLRRFAYRNIAPDWQAKVDLYQRQSTQLKIFHYGYIPLPLQTEGYATAMLSAGYAAGLVTDVEAAVARRMKLQSAMLDRSDPPTIWAVLDEATLHSFTDRTIMKAQLEYLVELGELPHVSVRVVPRMPLPHIGIDGSFWLFALPGHRAAAFAGTTLDIGKVIDDPAEVTKVALRFDKIAALALNEVQTRDLLLEMIKAYDGMA